MKTNKNQLKEVSQILELEDNKVLIELYGQHDENLTKIENNFGIHISYRGNIIEFRGNQDACSSASKFISNVYNKLASGKKINGDIFDNFSNLQKSFQSNVLTFYYYFVPILNVGQNRVLSFGLYKMVN